jgi:hypothetical protein
VPDKWQDALCELDQSVPCDLTNYRGRFQILGRSICGAVEDETKFVSLCILAVYHDLS